MSAVPSALRWSASVALAAAFVAMAEMWLATGIWYPGIEATLVYPYLASSAVFVTVATWILESIRHMKHASGVSAVKVFLVTFTVVLILMLATGASGAYGEQAVDDLNLYLAHDLNATIDIAGLTKLALSPFRVVAAAGIALSLGCFVVIGRVSSGVSTTARGASVPQILRRLTELNRLMVAGSALFVASVAALFLLFASAAQLHELRPTLKAAMATRTSPPCTPASAPAKPTAASTSSSAPATPAAQSPAKVSFNLSCQAAASGGMSSCVLDALPVKVDRQPSNPAMMALVLGLAFTGALFILFSTCGANLDDALEAKLTHARYVALGAKQAFSAKDWREQYGIAESASDRVLKAVTLLAPALAGAFTLIAGG